MKIYSYEPSDGTGYAVLADSEIEAMITIRDYLYNKAEKNPFGTANNGSHYLSFDL